MAVDVEIFGLLLPGAPRRQALELDKPLTAEAVAALIGLDPELVGLIVIDRVQSEWEDVVPVNGRICFFPPVSGG